MKQKILQYLNEIERQYDVRIIFAVETGSRAWGFASPDSDWDVRFVYVHRLNWYLTVEPGRDVIEVTTEDGFDAVGWDIRKALILFKKTNLAILEWLNSPIIYIDSQPLRTQLENLLPQYFNTKRALYHYYHIATNHQNRYLERRGVELKRYLYFLRALLACRWIVEQQSPPPVLFNELVRATVSDAEIVENIGLILKLKSESKEHDKQIIEPILQEYGANLESEISTLIQSFEEHKPMRCHDSDLNKILYDFIMHCP